LEGKSGKQVSEWQYSRNIPERQKCVVRIDVRPIGGGEKGLGDARVLGKEDGKKAGFVVCLSNGGMKLQEKKART